MNKIVSVGMICGLAASLSSSRADQQAETARSIIARHKASAVTLVIVLKMGGYLGGDQQNELEVDGVVLDSSGLVATTNMSIDPMAMYSSMAGDTASGGSTKVVSVKIITASGDEIPAKVVLRDKDKNLAFLRPLKPVATPLAAVDFRTSGKAQVGDPVYILGRLGKAGNRTAQVIMQRIISIVDRPRMLYATEPTMLNLGNAVFNEKGETLGLASVRITTSRRSSYNPTDSFLPVVIPADDVWEVAQQAPQAKDVKDTEPAVKPPAKPAGKPSGTKPGPTAPKGRAPTKPKPH